MNLASAKGMIAKLMLTGFAAGTFVAASPTTAQAQQFAVEAQFGQPVYAPAYVYDRDYPRYDRDRDFYYHEREEAREREAREEYLRRQAYPQHERWEHERWEHEHHFDRPYDYR